MLLFFTWHFNPKIFDYKSHHKIVGQITNTTICFLSFSYSRNFDKWKTISLKSQIYMIHLTNPPMLYKKTKFTWSAYAYRYSFPSTTILLWPHITTPISWIIPNLNKIMPLQTSSFKYLNVHHHLHMNPITIHLDDLLLYTMCVYRGWSKGNILYMKRAWI
jgi:hypothetical protein